METPPIGGACLAEGVRHGGRDTVGGQVEQAQPTCLCVEGLGFGVLGVGCGVWGVGCGVWG